MSSTSGSAPANRGLAEGKNVALFGVADRSSIGWTIARTLLDHGARVHLGYSQKFFSRVRLLLQELPAVQGVKCEVSDDGELAAFFDRFRGDPIDVLVHCVAFAPPELFTEPPSNVGAEALAKAIGVSVHSLCRIVRHAKAHLREWGSVIALSYQASERASPMYGLMGVAKAALESAVRSLALELGAQRVRVNAVSPGPIETVAALGITLAFAMNPEALSRQRGELLQSVVAQARADLGDGPQGPLTLAKAAFRRVQATIASHCPIQETVSQQDVADCALFLASDLSRKITAQVLRVDCGLSSKMIL